MLLCDNSLYSVVEQCLKCSTDEVFNCLIQFLLTMVLSIEERVFLLNTSFEKVNLVQEQFAEKFQKHLYLIVMHFVDLLRNFMKQAQCWTLNEVGDHRNLTIRSY